MTDALGASVARHPSAAALGGVSLDQARALLAEAETPADVKQLAERGQALLALARRAKLGVEARNEVAEFVLRTQREGGRMLATNPEFGRGKQSVTVTDYGIGHNDSKRWQRIAAVPDDEFEDYISRTCQTGGELTTSAVLQLARIVAAQDPVQRPRLHVVADTLPGLDGRFTTIVADPPWQYDNRATRNAAAKHYPTMDIAALCDLPVEAHANDDAHLYLWTTANFLRESFDVLAAWGFTYKTVLTWVKPQMGLGNYFRTSTEHVLFGVRGKLRTLDRATVNWFEAPRARHSAKPDSFYDLVEKCSPGPYLEMFARARRLGDWTAWGNEA